MTLLEAIADLKENNKFGAKYPGFPKNRILIVDTFLVEKGWIACFDNDGTVIRTIWIENISVKDAIRSDWETVELSDQQKKHLKDVYKGWENADRRYFNSTIEGLGRCDRIDGPSGPSGEKIAEIKEKLLKETPKTKPPVIKKVEPVTIPAATDDDDVF